METKKHVFTAMEKKYFMDIIKKYSRVIENKDTDGSSLRNKNEAWDKVTVEFNASPLATTQATHKQLRRLWMNLKQRQREALTKERQHRLATGGGPSTSDASIDPDISIVAPALIVGIDTAIDSDTIQDSQIPPEIIVEPGSVEKYEVITPEPPIILETTTVEQNIPPTTVRSPYHTQKAAQKVKLSVIEKEYKDRQKRADEKHELELKILKAQLRKSEAEAALAELILKNKQNLQEVTSEKKIL